MNNFRRGFAHVVLLIILGFAIVAGGTYYLVVSKENQKNLEEENNISDTSEWKTYRNENYKFEFKYPSEWTIKGDQFVNDKGELQGSIFVDASSDYLSLEAKKIGNERSEGETVKTEVITVDGLQILKTYFGGGAHAPAGYEIYFAADDFAVAISTTNDILLVDEIISSIRLTNSLSNKVTEEMILSAFNKNGGCDGKSGSQTELYVKSGNGYGCSSEGGSLFFGKFYYGDINYDGYKDAIFTQGSCGASCGNSLAAAINQRDGTVDIVGVTPNTWVTSSAAQTELKSIIISNNIISITANGYADSKTWDETVTKRFKFENNTLIEI